MRPYVFKSQALRDQQARNEAKEKEARSLLAKIGAEFVRIKQNVEELWGERGSNRAARQKDFSVFATMGKIRKDDGAYEINTVVAEIEKIKEELAKIARAKGASK